MRTPTGLGALGTTACSAKADARSDGSAPAANEDGGDPSSGRDGGADGATNPGGGSAGKPITSCTTATLFAGNPTYEAADPGVRPAEGTGILADPPFQYGSLTFVGKTLYTRDTGEIWSVDTSVASPVLRRRRAA